MGGGGTKVLFLAARGYHYSPFESSAAAGCRVPAELVKPHLGWET